MLKFFFEDGPNPNFHYFFANNVKHEKVEYLEDCDYVISAQLIFGVYDKKEIQKGLNIYKNYTKKVIIFLVTDSLKSFYVPENVLLFRTSLLKTKQKINEFVLPYIFEQPLNFNAIEKTELPKIGFCGQTQHNIGKRKSTIKAFLKSKTFETNFIERNGFWNGKPNDENLKIEFENNIYNNHFNICNKGRGNFSIRFYQVFSAGRIPVVLDTNIKLPFDNEIDYKNHIIISKSNKRLVKKTLEFYDSKTSQELKEIHEQNKQLYQEYFSFEGFGKKIESLLKIYNFVKKKMVVLILTREYNHPYLKNKGGTGAFMRILAENLVANNHEVHVIGIFKNKIEFEEKGVKISFHKSLFQRNFFIETLRSVTKNIKYLQFIHKKVHFLERNYTAKIVSNYIKKNALKVDIIETHDFEGIYLQLNTSIPIVVRFHGSYNLFERFFNYKNIELGRKYYELEAVKKTKNYITVSEYSDRLNKEIYHLSNTKIIYNGIDTEIFKSNKIKTIDYSIFYFGTISKEKGADTAIAILIELLKIDLRYSLHYVGRNTDYNKILHEKIIKLKIEKNVIFYGVLNQKELIDTISKAEVFVFPSTGETFGLALCEAMSMEKLVICNRLEAFQEIIKDGENGFFADNALDYAKKINKYFSNKELYNKIRKNARQSVEEKFSINQMVSKTINYYKKLIT